MEGMFPAENPEIARFRTLGVEPFTGPDGPSLSFEIERLLSQPDGGNRPYFTIIVPGGEPPDAVVSGTSQSGATENKFTRNEDVCTAKDPSGKCTSKVQKIHYCIRRVTELRSDVRVFDNTSGRVVFSQLFPQRNEFSWCDNAQPPNTIDAAVRQMTEATAKEFRRIAAPVTRSYQVRFRETTTGMDKQLKADFKQAIRMTQTNLPAACTTLAGLDARAPNHPSILFNRGLCDEVGGLYAGAVEFYRRAAGLMGNRGEAAEALDRINQLMAAEQTAASRG